jgi:hypothetical protein
MYELRARFMAAKTKQFIGPRGANVNALRIESGITFLKNDFDREPGIVTFVGSEASVNVAMGLLTDRVDPMAQACPHWHSH